MTFKIGRNHIVLSKGGRRKIMNLRFKDSEMLRGIFKEIFVDRTYFKKFDHGRVFSINRTDTVIDIGANVGFFSVCAANLAFKGNVFAFEPVKENFQQLARHKSENHLNNLIAQNLAVADTKRDARIYLDDNNCGGHSFYREEINILNNRDALNFEEVHCIPLKDVFDRYEIKTCDFLKIDTEGAEYSILEALPKEYFQKIKKIALEYHPAPGKSAWNLADYLNEMGFAIYIFHWKKNFGRMFAYRKQRCA